MAIHLQSVVPFGRSLDEYVKMFNLTNFDKTRSILSVADGPASFNAEATQQNMQVTSIDPIYQFNAAEIYSRFNAVLDNIIEQIRTTPKDWVWSYHCSPDDLRRSRVQTIQRFIQDYAAGKRAKRYIYGHLPRLEAEDKTFDLTLCSHFLFLYSDHYNFQFHLNSIQEMLRVSQEVRIFPLLTLDLKRSPHLDGVTKILTNQGYVVSVQSVEYELQRGGNEMIAIKRD